MKHGPSVMERRRIEPRAATPRAIESRSHSPGARRVAEPQLTGGTVARVVLLGDLDSLIREAQDERARARLRKLGFALEGLPRLVATRDRLAEGIEPRWASVYERVRQRYGRGVAAVRERVCTGCFVTLPTTARPRAGSDGLQVCESCGRLLYWT